MCCGDTSTLIRRCVFVGLRVTCFVFFLIITVNSFHIVYNILLIFSIIFFLFLFVPCKCMCYVCSPYLGGNKEYISLHLVEI